MGHEEEASLVTGQEALQPFDALQIQVVRGLIQQEKARLSRQSPPQKSSALLSAGKGGECLPPVQLEERAEALDGMIPPECVVEPGANQGLHGTFQIPGNALREESYPQPRRNHQGPLIGLLDSGQNLQ
jgi:hypothetical protein